MVFKAAPARNRWEGLAVCTWIVLIDILFVVWIWVRPVDWIQFVLIVLVLLSIPLFVHLAYRTWSLFTLEYWVDRNAVTVAWAGMRQVIPLHQIRQIVENGAQDLSRPGWRHWPAHHMRVGRTLGMLNLTLLATRPLPDCLLLDSGDAVYAISPADPDQFLDILQERFQLGPAIRVRAERQRVSPVLRLWEKLAIHDAVGISLLLGGVGGALVLFGVLMIRFPGLPADLVMRYNADGLPELIRDKSALFLLPAIGLMTWLVNGLWGLWLTARDQPLGAYMLWGGAIAVQLFALLALIDLMP